MKRLQPLIPVAIEAIEKNIKENNGAVSSEMNGYISSFGASIISAGLLPTIVFFSQKGGSSGGREKLIPALEFILEKNYDPKINLLQKVMEFYKNDTNKVELNRLTQKVNDAIIVLKLALRTFPNAKTK